MSFKFSFSTLCVAATSLGLFSLPSHAAESFDFGTIAFVGDSITQGGGGANGLSYRYPLWKIFVSNDVAWKPVGSMKTFKDKTPASDTLTPDFRGEKYNNANEGHYGWTTGQLLDGRTTTDGSGSGKLSDWLSNTAEYYPTYPDTLFVLIGFNDLAHTTYSTLEETMEATVANTKAIIEQYRAKNADVNIHVLSVLPSTDVWNFDKNIWAGKNQDSAVILKEYSEYLENEIRTQNWSTETSTVQFHDITEGFDPAGFTADNIHPNAAGALHVAKNIATALGLDANIDLGITQKTASALASQTTFASSGTSIKATVETGEKKQEISVTNSKGEASWTVDSSNRLKISSGTTDESYIHIENWGTTSDENDFTFEISVKMEDSGAENNVLGIFLGNGKEVGFLYIGESGIFWDGAGDRNLLYGGVSEGYMDDFATKDYIDLRVAYISGEVGVAAGYYVWLGDELIGDCLSGNSNAAQYNNSLLIGDTSPSSYSVSAYIESISFEVGKGYQPTSAVPEPSAFGLLAGIGALALVASRRRRK